MVSAFAWGYIYHFPKSKVRKLLRSFRIASTHALLRDAQQSAGSGRYVAHLILKQNDPIVARRLLDNFRSTPHVVDEAYPYVAFSMILERVGRDEDTIGLTVELPERVSSKQNQEAREALFFDTALSGR